MLVTKAAPRIAKRLQEAIERLDDRRLPIAETAGRVGAEAERLGLTRPSYEQVRVYVQAGRRKRVGPTIAEVALGVALRLRPPEALLDQLSGVGVPKL